MNTLISVIIVTHNRERLLTGAIDSVLRQKFSDFELVIIDDASTDNTGEVVKKYLVDKRVKYKKVAKCHSIAQVRNSAWPYVSGKYIAILDSDDIWCDDSKLNKQFEFLENNINVVLVGGGAIMINEQGEEINRVFEPVSDNDIKKDFFIKNPFFHSSVMYRLDTVKQLGGYDEKVNYGEDFDLWLRMGKIGQLHNIPDIFIKYRVHKDNEPNKHFFQAIIDTLKVIKRNRKDYGLSLSIYFKKIYRKFFEYFYK